MFRHFNYFPGLLNKNFIKQITAFDRRIVTISGGVDSTATALALFDQGIECELLWNDTRRTMKAARHQLAKIFKLTGWKFHITYPMDIDHKKLREQCIEAIRLIEDGSKEYSKNLFPCCYHLKEKPLDIWIKHDVDPWNTVIISSIAAYESHQRNIRLGELRNRGTYLRFKRKKYFQAYPWRDFTTRRHGKLLEDYVNYRIGDAVHSGCNACPVLTLFDIPGEEIRTERSLKVYASSSN